MLQKHWIFSVAGTVWLGGLCAALMEEGHMTGSTAFSSCLIITNGKWRHHATLLVWRQTSINNVPLPILIGRVPCWSSLHHRYTNLVTINMRNICNSYVILVGVFFDCLTQYYDMIYLLTAIGLSPGGRSTVHIYAQTIHRTIQNRQYIEQHNNFGRVRAVPRLG